MMDLTAYRAGTGGGSSGWGVADATGCHSSGRDTQNVGRDTQRANVVSR